MDERELFNDSGGESSGSDVIRKGVGDEIWEVAQSIVKLDKRGSFGNTKDENSNPLPVSLRLSSEASAIQDASSMFHSLWGSDTLMSFASDGASASGDDKPKKQKRKKKSLTRKKTDDTHTSPKDSLKTKQAPIADRIRDCRRFLIDVDDNLAAFSDPLRLSRVQRGKFDKLKLKCASILDAADTFAGEADLKTSTCTARDQLHLAMPFVYAWDADDSPDDNPACKLIDAMTTVVAGGIAIAADEVFKEALRRNMNICLCELDLPFAAAVVTGVQVTEENSRGTFCTVAELTSEEAKKTMQQRLLSNVFLHFAQMAEAGEQHEQAFLHLTKFCDIIHANVLALVDEKLRMVFSYARALMQPRTVDLTLLEEALDQLEKSKNMLNAVFPKSPFARRLLERASEVRLDRLIMHTAWDELRQLKIPAALTRSDFNDDFWATDGAGVPNVKEWKSLKTSSAKVFAKIPDRATFIERYKDDVARVVEPQMASYLAVVEATCRSVGAKLSVLAKAILVEHKCRGRLTLTYWGTTTRDAFLAKCDSFNQQLQSLKVWLPSSKTLDLSVFGCDAKNTDAYMVEASTTIDGLLLSLSFMATIPAGGITHVANELVSWLASKPWSYLDESAREHMALLSKLAQESIVNQFASVFGSWRHRSDFSRKITSADAEIWTEKYDLGIAAVEESLDPDFESDRLKCLSESFLGHTVKLWLHSNEFSTEPDAIDPLKAPAINLGTATVPLLEVAALVLTYPAFLSVASASFNPECPERTFKLLREIRAQLEGAVSKFAAYQIPAEWKSPCKVEQIIKHGITYVDASRGQFVMVLYEIYGKSFAKVKLALTSKELCQINDDVDKAPITKAIAK